MASKCWISFRLGRRAYHRPQVTSSRRQWACSPDLSCVAPPHLRLGATQAPRGGHAGPGPLAQCRTLFIQLCKLVTWGPALTPSSSSSYSIYPRVLSYSLNIPRMPPWNLSISSPPQGGLSAIISGSLLCPPRWSIYMYSSNFFKSIFLEEPEWSFYNANRIISPFASNPSMTFHCF